MTQTLALAREPHDIVASIEAHLNTLDAAMAVRLYDPEAIIVDAAGNVHQGLTAIGDELGRYFSLGLPISMTLRHQFTTGDTALLVMDWTMSGTARDGSQVEMSGTASDIVRRGDDGFWRYYIDNPFGTQRRNAASSIGSN